MNKVMALATGAILSASSGAWGASCCGGGSSTALVLPKFATQIYDVAFDFENYDGYWNQDGDKLPDPAGSDLNQYRANFGFAYRLADRWQAGFSLPYVWNDNKYSGIASSTQGLGDTTVGFWYETFDDITCIWRVTDWQSLKPAIYLGGTVTLPTGKSAYGDEVENSFDITGRGFYRFDGNLLMEKTIYPWNLSAKFSYGKYLERPVNQEYGNAVQPYRKQLGDRIQGTIAGGYTYFFDNMSTMTVTAAYNDLREAEGEIDGQPDPSSKMKKQSVGLQAAYSLPELDWIFRLSYSHAIRSDGFGQNFPLTDVVSLRVSYVVR